MMLAIGVAMPYAAAQHNDPNLRKQINAVFGVDKWEFAPGFNYWLLHQHYSGASMHYSFPFSINYKFDEEKASTKRIWRPIINEVVLQEQRKQLMEEQNQELDKSYTDMLMSVLDRQNPIVSQSYREYFEKYQDGMEEALNLACKYSGGKEMESIKKLMLKNELLVSEVEYVTTQVPNAGALAAGAMESGARQKELERIYTEMGELYGHAVNFAKYCYLKYRKSANITAQPVDFNPKN
ncbi:MAG: hypothetical protein NC193_03520 [bacterium]|nr:hypothetical protein [bacterium]